YVKSAHFEIRSELPMQIEVNDPKHQLDVHSEKKGSDFSLTVDQKSPTHYHVIEEEHSFLEPKMLPWVQLSSGKTWGEVVQGSLPHYEEISNSKLQASFERIAEAAKTKTT